MVESIQPVGVTKSSCCSGGEKVYRNNDGKLYTKPVSLCDGEAPVAAKVKETLKLLACLPFVCLVALMGADCSGDEPDTNYVNQDDVDFFPQNNAPYPNLTSTTEV